jgi:hypothetical protein
MSRVILDINGQELHEGDPVSLLCQITAIETEGIAVRIMNSEMVLQVGIRQDEALGGLVADSELTKFMEIERTAPTQEKDPEISRSVGSGATFE